MDHLKTHYENLEEIGRGGFGVVYRAKCIARDSPCYGNIVAIKKVDVSKVPGFRVGLELQALESLHHESIVDFYEQFREGGAQYIVMEYCKYGSLRDFVKRNGKLSDQCAAFIVRQLVNAVKHIHAHGMMHRDLSAGNVLISSMRNNRFRVKLADFGLATMLRQGDVTGTIVGTPGYIAPQVYGRNYNQKADVFSLGGIVYLMLMGKDPPREQNTKQLDLHTLSEEGAELIRLMMHPDEDRRITLQDIRMSAFSRMADEFDVSGTNSFRDGSREIIRRSSREYYQHSYAQPVRLRAQSAQPRASSNTRQTKESGFESGDVEFINARRPSTETGCRHSTYDGSVCRRCGIRRSRERANDRIPNNNFSTVGPRGIIGNERVGRPERRSYASRRMLSDARTTNMTGISARTSAAGTKTWPIDITRLAPNKLVIGAGRFQFLLYESGKVIYEVAGRRRSVSRSRVDDQSVVGVMVVETRALGGQLVTVYTPQRSTPFPSHNDPPLHVQPANCNTYTSWEDLESNQTHLRFYRQVIEATRRIGGRVEKVVFKPSVDTTARLMENGDFRLKFSDGRLAVQKRGTSSVSVTGEACSKASLSEDEMRMFNDARSDALEMERMLENAAFLGIKPFPFHFSNTSLFSTAITTDNRHCGEGNNQRVIPTDRLSNRQRSLPRFTSEDSNRSSSRRPLGNLDGNLHTDDRQAAQRKATPSYGTENRQVETENKREEQTTPRLLREGEYKLRAHRDAMGKRVITSISSVGEEPIRSVRVSTTSPNIFIYHIGTQSSQTSRFRFDGFDFSNVPQSARNLAYTLYRKREEFG